MNLVLVLGHEAPWEANIVSKNEKVTLNISISDYICHDMMEIQGQEGQEQLYHSI